jgi:hypothetical protein
MLKRFFILMPGLMLQNFFGRNSRSYLCTNYRNYTNNVNCAEKSLYFDTWADVIKLFSRNLHRYLCKLRQNNKEYVDRNVNHDEKNPRANVTTIFTPVFTKVHNIKKICKL